MSVKVRPYKKRGGFEIDIVVKLVDGRVLRQRVKSPVTSKSGSQRWGEERERHLLLNPPSEAREDVPTLAVFVSRYMEGYVRANRFKESGISSKECVIRVHLVPALGAYPLDEITNEHVQKLKRSLAKKSPKTVNNVLTVLNSMLATAVEWGLLERKPCEVRLLKVVERKAAFYDYAQYEQLLAGARGLGLLYVVLVLLGGDAGLRLGEIIALEWRDLNLDRGVLHVERSDWHGHVDVPKGGRSREVPLTRRLLDALKELREATKGKTARVLVREGGEALTKKVVRNWMATIQRAAKMPVTSAVHVLRHTFCSHLAMRGAPPKAIQEIAGHRDLKTTQRYLHLTPEVARSAIELLDRGHPAR